MPPVRPLMLRRTKGRPDLNVKPLDLVAVRAEPISALYEKNVPPKGYDGEWPAKVVHAKEFPALEDELCTWKPLEDTESPNRIDALVWAATALIEGGGNGDWVG